MDDRPDFTHFDASGRAAMVNVGSKDSTQRKAAASCRVIVNRTTLELIKTGGMKKGDVLGVARIAGIMGAKRTASLIPLCHNIVLDSAGVNLVINDRDCCIEISCEVSCNGRTGAEMEALTAVSVAALTVYDMCKAVQRDIRITDIALESKSGGVHGDYAACPPAGPHGRPLAEKWIEELKNSAGSKDIGMFLVHNGIVRESPRSEARDGAKGLKRVTAMHVQYDNDKVEAARKRALSMPGISAARVWINRGTLNVGDDIMLVLVGGDIRPNVVNALQDLVAELKTNCITEQEIF